MKNAVKEYIELSDVEKQDLWAHAMFVFDTNVFLNLYRFSKKTREMLIGAMTRLSDRIWMPNHVAHEFMKDRTKIVLETGDRYSKLQKDVEQLNKSFVESLRLQETDKEYAELQGNIESIQQWLLTHQKDNVIVTETSEDKILEILLSLYDGKVGTAFSDEELKDIKNEGSERYKRKMPPGYKDAQKITPDNDNNAYGDLIVWKEILRFAAEKKVDIIFVTHDRKEDWWNIVHGKTVGPRVELRKEFIDTTGQRILMYNMDMFLSQSEIQQGREIDPSIVDEVQSVPQSQPAEKEENQTWKLREMYLAELQELEVRLEHLHLKNAKREESLKKLQRKYQKNGHTVEVGKQLKSTRANYNKAQVQIAQIQTEIAHLHEEMDTL